MLYVPLICIYIDHVYVKRFTKEAIIPWNDFEAAWKWVVFYSATRNFVSLHSAGIPNVNWTL